jgi:hypothetical protein
MQNTQKRVPTLVAILMLVVLMVGAVFITSQIKNSQQFSSSADEPNRPENVGIANVTDTSVTVYWTSQKEVAGAVLFGTTPNLGGSVAFDERDTSGKTGQFSTHLVRLVNLKPETLYYFKISSGSTIFGNAEKNGDPFEIKTFPEIEAGPFIEPIYGKLTSIDGTGEKGALVLWNASNATQLAVLSKTDGSFVIPLSNVRVSDGSGPLNLPLGTAETIDFITKAGPAGSISCITGQDKPLPSVKIGESARCQDSQSNNQLPGQSQTVGRFVPPVSESTEVLTVNITEGQTVVTAMPIISGKAPAGEILRVQINGKNNFSGTLKTASDGSWSWTPPANLSTGQNTLVVTVMTGSKAKTNLTRKFIAPGNDKILGISTGTPSATPEHFSCVDNACIKVSGAGSDSCTSDTDCQPVVTPPATSSGTTTPPPPVVEPKPPVTGAVENTLFALTWGVLFITLGVGAILFIAK